jgi:hypothetical protein
MKRRREPKIDTMSKGDGTPRSIGKTAIDKGPAVEYKFWPSPFLSLGEKVN